VQYIQYEHELVNTPIEGLLFTLNNQISSS